MDEKLGKNVLETIIRASENGSGQVKVLSLLCRMETKTKNVKRRHCIVNIIALNVEGGGGG